VQIIDIVEINSYTKKKYKAIAEKMGYPRLHVIKLWRNVLSVNNRTNIYIYIVLFENRFTKFLVGKHLSDNISYSQWCETRNCFVAIAFQF